MGEALWHCVLSPGPSRGWKGVIPSGTRIESLTKLGRFSNFMEGLVIFIPEPNFLSTALVFYIASAAMFW